MLENGAVNLNMWLLRLCESGARNTSPYTGIVELRRMLESMASDKHPVCLLQELFQKRHCPVPLYTALGQLGPDRLHHTNVSFFLDDRQHMTFHGCGTNKKTSKANAAQKALEYINETRPKLVEPPPSKMQRPAAKKRRLSSWRERV